MTAYVAVLHLKASNDVNGNPRRGFLLLGDKGEPARFILEGYKGSGVLPEEVRALGLWYVTVNVTPKEYRSWVVWERDRVQEGGE